MITKTEKTLKEDAEKAIGVVAAEFSYAKALLEQITKIEQEESDKATKDLKKGFRLFRWIARGERNAHHTELKIIGDLESWGEELPAESKKWEEKVVEQLKVVDGKLVKAASRFKGTIRQELLEIETEEQLLEKLSKNGFSDNRGVKMDLSALFKEAKSDIEQLEQWLSAMEAILGEIISKIKEEAAIVAKEKAERETTEKKATKELEGKICVKAKVELLESKLDGMAKTSEDVIEYMTKVLDATYEIVEQSKRDGSWEQTTNGWKNGIFLEYLGPSVTKAWFSSHTETLTEEQREQRKTIVTLAEGCRKLQEAFLVADYTIQERLSYQLINEHKSQFAGKLPELSPNQKQKMFDTINSLEIANRKIIMNMLKMGKDQSIMHDVSHHLNTSLSRVVSYAQRIYG